MSEVSIEFDKDYLSEYIEKITWLHKKEKGKVKALVATDPTCENCKQMIDEVIKKLDNEFDYFEYKTIYAYKIPTTPQNVPITWLTYGLTEKTSAQPEIRGGVGQYDFVKRDVEFMHRCATEQITPQELIEVERKEEKDRDTPVDHVIKVN